MGAGHMAPSPSCRLSGTAARPSPGPPNRRPAHGPTPLSAALGVSAVHEAADGGPAARAGGGGWRRDQRSGQQRKICAVIGGAACRRRQPAGPARDGFTGDRMDDGDGPT